MASRPSYSRQSNFELAVGIADKLYSQFVALKSVPEFKLHFEPPYLKSVKPVVDSDPQVTAFLMDTVYLYTYHGIIPLGRIKADALIPVVLLDYRLHSASGEGSITTLSQYDSYVSEGNNLSQVMDRLSGYLAMSMARICRPVEIQSLHAVSGTDKATELVDMFDELLLYGLKRFETTNNSAYGFHRSILSHYLPAEELRKRESKWTAFGTIMLIINLLTTAYIIWFFGDAGKTDVGFIVGGIWFAFWLTCSIVAEKSKSKPRSFFSSYSSYEPSSASFSVSSSKPAKASGSRYGWLDDFDMTKDYYGKHGEFDTNDESRRASEDIQQFHNCHPDTDLSDHYYWDDVLDAETDGYLDD